MSAYRLVFDIADTPTDISAWLLIPIALTGVGALLVFKPMLMQRLLPGGLQGGARTAFSWFYFLFAALMTVITLIGNFSANYILRTARSDGSFSVTEGCLQTFHPMPYDGHDTERLGINGRCFSYSDYILTPAFNHTEAHGGPVHADSRLKVYYVGGSIVRLEVADHACPAAPDVPKGKPC